MSAQSITQALEKAGVTLQRAPIKGQPRVIGQSADRLTLIEVLGQLAQPHKIVLTGIFAADADPAARRNASLMAGLLQLTMPTWRERNHWLTTFLGEAAERRRTLATLGPIRAELRYNPRLNSVTLTIWVRGGPSRGTAPTA